MSNVIPLFPEDHVSLEWGFAGPIDAATVVFWLVWHEPDGTATNVWDGEEYADALKAAEYWQQNGIRLEDTYGPEMIGGAA